MRWRVPASTGTVRLRRAAACQPLALECLKRAAKLTVIKQDPGNEGGKHGKDNPVRGNDKSRIGAKM